jgi:hypothetical protein
MSRRVTTEEFVAAITTGDGRVFVSEDVDNSDQQRAYSEDQVVKDAWIKDSRSTSPSTRRISSQAKSIWLVPFHKRQGQTKNSSSWISSAL